MVAACDTEIICYMFIKSSADENTHFTHYDNKRIMHSCCWQAISCDRNTTRPLKSALFFQPLTPLAFSLVHQKIYAAHLIALQWRHSGHDCISNHRRLDCLFNRLFRRRSKKTSKSRVAGLCEGNSPVTGEFPAQRASNAENASNWWRHHDISGNNWCRGIFENLTPGMFSQRKLSTTEQKQCMGRW